MNKTRDFASRSRRSRRARSSRRTLSAVLAVAALTAAAVMFARRAPPTPTQPVASVTTAAIAPPVAQVWSNAERVRLRNRLNAAFAPALAGASHWSLCVVDADGRVIFGERDRIGVKPASVQKIVVASVALDMLGPAYRYHTRLSANGDVRDDGALPGDLYFIGSGDPSLRSTDLDAGVRALYRRGIRRLNASVIVDATAFEGPEINPFWNPGDANEDFQAPVSAVSLDEDTVEFDVRGTTPGAPASVRENPWSSAVGATGSVMTSSPDDAPDVIVASGSAPNHFELSGEVPAQRLDREWVPVHGIEHYAGTVLTELLREHGIAVALPPAVGRAPRDATVLWEHSSPTLRDLERHMLYLSDNHFADQLLRTLGSLAGGAGNDARGRAAERRDLAQRGVPVPGMRLVDGSGLAEANRLSALTLAEILAHALSDAPERGFYDLLPQGGRSGTLKGYRFTTALGRVRAKTGHLSDVASLAGYVVSRRHGIVAFAFMIDGSPDDPDGAMVHAVDRIAEL